jgi:hypothetical protein
VLWRVERRVMEGVRVAISAATPFETEVLPHYAGLVRRLTLIVADGGAHTR